MTEKISLCLYVTLLVDEQVLRLEIPVDEIQRVKVFKCQYNLGCVEAGVWFTVKQITQNGKQSNKSRRERFRNDLKLTYLNLPILLKCENISPPGTYSIIIYRLLLSCREASTVLVLHAEHTVKTR